MDFTSVLEYCNTEISLMCWRLQYSAGESAVQRLQYSAGILLSMYIEASVLCCNTAIQYLETGLQPKKTFKEYGPSKT